MNSKRTEVGTMDKRKKDLEQIIKLSELTEEELEKLAMDYWFGGAWEEIIPQDKEISQEPHLMTEEQKKMYSILLKAKTKDEMKQAFKELYKSYGIEILPEELEVIENWEPDDIDK